MNAAQCPARVATQGAKWANHLPIFHASFLSRSDKTCQFIGKSRRFNRSEHIAAFMPACAIAECCLREIITVDTLRVGGVFCGRAAWSVSRKAQSLSEERPEWTRAINVQGAKKVAG
jgi:hypothetical protein